MSFEIFMQVGRFSFLVFSWIYLNIVNLQSLTKWDDIFVLSFTSLVVILEDYSQYGIL